MTPIPSPVAAIIRRNLLASRSITLPSFGTLEIERSPATLVDSQRRLACATRYVIITDTPSTSIIDYIADGLGVDTYQATAQYNAWVDDAIFEDLLIIDQVGTFGIGNETMELTPEFATLLNGTAIQSVAVRNLNQQRSKPTTGAAHKPTRGNSTSDNSNFWLVLVLIITLAAASYLVYHFFDEISLLWQ